VWGAATTAAAEPGPCDGEKRAGDIVSGPNGRAVVNGTEADDRFLVTGPGKRINGLGGNDTICYRGTTTGVVIDGGAGTDYIVSENYAGDLIHGGLHDDLIYSTGGDDQVFGDEGDDKVFAGPGNDRVDGGAGNDALRGAAGQDMLDGWAGIDRCLGGEDYDSSQGCETNEQIEAPAP
jgi:Ca2+-binding RTX toxin-like protein